MVPSQDCSTTRHPVRRGIFETHGDSDTLSSVILKTRWWQPFWKPLRLQLIFEGGVSRPTWMGLQRVRSGNPETFCRRRRLCRGVGRQRSTIWVVIGDPSSDSDRVSGRDRRSLKNLDMIMTSF